MTTHLGSYNTATTRTHVRFQFSTHAAAGANVAPGSAFEAGDLRIYKAADGAAFSATQRSSSNGITMTSPFDSLTGYHDVDIDLTDNTDAGFYAAGCLYVVTLAPDTETIDSQTITGIPLAYFEIGVPAVNLAQWLGTAPLALSSQQVQAVVPATQKVDVETIKTQSVTCGAGVTVGAFVGNATAALAVDASGRVDIGKILGTASQGAAGYMGPDWGHVNAPTTTVGLSGTTIGTATTLTNAPSDSSGVTTLLSRVGGTINVTNLNTLSGHDPGEVIMGATDLDAALAALAGYVDTEVAAIKAKTDNLPSDPADQSAVEAAITAAAMTAAGIRSAVGLANANLDTQLAAIAADSPNTPTKNVALSNLMFSMVDATDFNTPETGVTVTAQISKDGGSFASCSNSVTEVGSGFYKISLTSDELNADSIALKFTGTGCAQRNFSFRTQPT